MSPTSAPVSPRVRASRALAVPVLVVLALVLSGCVAVVAGRGSPFAAPVSDAPDGSVPIVGATDDPIDTAARNALSDLQAYWTTTLPDVYGQQFQPLQGGFFSVDPNDVNRSDFPDGVGCGAQPQDVEGNAFYCQAEGQPNSDSISYDRAFLADLADQYGRFIPLLVMAHEFGHAIQARVGYPDTSIATETQADCLAGAWTAWVAAGNAQHSTIRPPELDEVLRGFVTLRDPVGTSPAQQQAHGSYFDRVSGFQDGFDGGAAACRDNWGGDRVFTQGQFTSDEDFRNNGNASFADTQDILGKALPEFWGSAFGEVLGGTFAQPTVQEFDQRAPDCAGQDLELVFCADQDLVGYSKDIATRSYQIGDYAVVTAVSLPYSLSARDQIGRSTDGADAVRSSVCLTGWFSAQVYNDRVTSVRISPGDIDESVQFLLEFGTDPSVIPDVGLTGFQLVDLYRNGFLQGAKACDVGVG